VASYHLICDPTKIEYEIEQYQKNWIDIVDSNAEIWKMHNWSGIYKTVNFKRKGERKTCGRPFSPDLTIRAGGNDGHKLSVAPCCQTLGRDSEAVLGNLDDESLDKIWNGEKYQWLRKMHSKKRFDEISFCRDCDFLYSDSSVLVWTNYDRKLNKMIGTNFSLDDYR
jgi:MoaA/NifB/PqqE/SkfB family radical SAM enzyme